MQTNPYDLNTKLVHYSDPHCILKVDLVGECFLFKLWSQNQTLNHLNTRHEWFMAHLEIFGLVLLAIAQNLDLCVKYLWFWLSGIQMFSSVTIRIPDTQILDSFENRTKMSSIQMPFQYQTICKLDNFFPFEYQTCPVFRWLLYLDLTCNSWIRAGSERKIVKKIMTNFITSILLWKLYYLLNSCPSTYHYLPSPCVPEYRGDTII